MKKYGTAWENQDTQLLISCFVKNGVYQESPLSKPYIGHKEIADFWNSVVLKKTAYIKFALKKCYLADDKKTGFAEWECNNLYKNKRHHMAGIMLLKMKQDKITYLNEYWNSEVK